MPSEVTSTQNDHNCLVCGETTRISHLGIVCCRACAVFYRRTVKRLKEYHCQSSSQGQCATGRGLTNCKRCRYDRIVRLLEEKCEQQKIAKIEEAGPSDDVPLPQTNVNRPFLERVRANYNAMCFNRLSSELNARPVPPHPLDISLEDGPFYYANWDAGNYSTRLLLTASLEFGRFTFPEFAELAKSDKWKLTLNFFYRFHMFEGCYRANKMFPNEDKYFIHYSAYVNLPYDEEFLRTAPEGADISGFIKCMQKSTMHGFMRSVRKLIERVNPSEEEFLAVVVFMFWTYCDLSSSDDIIRIGAEYRSEILKELHAYYSDEKGLEDYAARFGELMLLVQSFERTKNMKEQFEVMRLFNIVTEDSFVYQLQKDLTIS